MDPLAQWNQFRWHQLNELDHLRHSLGTLLDRSLVHWTRYLSPPEWIPVVTVSENLRAYVLNAQLPLVKAEDVHLLIVDGMLIITGDRKFYRNRKKANPSQYCYGRFVHCFALPPDALPAKVSGLLKNGVLLVHVAKNSTAKKSPRRVENQSAIRAGEQISFHTVEPARGRAMSHVH